jgi:hypothetical protein
MRQNRSSQAWQLESLDNIRVLGETLQRVFVHLDGGFRFAKKLNHRFSDSGDFPDGYISNLYASTICEILLIIEFVVRAFCWSWNSISGC